MGAETERQARAGQGPDQQRQAVHLREGPGSSGAGLRLIFSRKQSSSNNTNLEKAVIY